MQLIGRDAPLGVLRAALSRGNGAVLVRGEPGIGKTSLVDALAREAAARGHTVLAGRTDPDDGAPPLWPWLQALSGRPERAGLVALAGPLPTTADPAAAAQAGRAARLLAFEAVLDRLSAAPTVVVLEDLHWADEPSLVLLGLAADRAGVLVVATYRDTEAAPALRAAVADLRRRSSTEVITLRPWDDADVAALLPAAVHPSWAPVLCRTAAGLPLLVTALLEDLLDTDRAAHSAPADGAWPLDAPERLVDLTAERLARLDPPARQAVEIAAVAGAGCCPAHLARLGAPGGPAAVEALEAGVSAGLLVPSPSIVHGYDFRHALLRDSVYAQVPAVRRVPWHAAIADGDRGGRAARRAGDPPAARGRRPRVVRGRRRRLPRGRRAGRRRPRVRPRRRAAGRGPAPARRRPHHPPRPGAVRGGRRLRRRPGGDGGAALPRGGRRGRHRRPARAGGAHGARPGRPAQRGAPAALRRRAHRPPRTRPGGPGPGAGAAGVGRMGERGLGLRRRAQRGGAAAGGTQRVARSRSPMRCGPANTR